MSPAVRQPVKSYNNIDFLNSPEARPLRILAEFFEPLKRFTDNNVRGTIVFFGSSRILPEKDARATLRQVKKKLASSKKATPFLLFELRMAENLVKMSKNPHCRPLKLYLHFPCQ